MTEKVVHKLISETELHIVRIWAAESGQGTDPPFTILKVGDIVEVQMPKGHLHASYDGLKFKIEKFSYLDSDRFTASGWVLKQPKNRTLNSTVNWSLPQFLVVTKPELEKYFSPFTGRWV